MRIAIKHILHIDAPINEVYEKLSTIDGLRAWWTDQTSGNPEKDGEIQFKFGEPSKIMKVQKLTANEVVWEVIKCDHAPEWLRTTIRYKLSENEGKTKVSFSHEGWSEQSDFYAHCSFSWAKYLISLRNLVEIGKGEPFVPQVIEN